MPLGNDGSVPSSTRARACSAGKVTQHMRAVPRALVHAARLVTHPSGAARPAKDLAQQLAHAPHVNAACASKGSAEPSK